MDDYHDVLIKPQVGKGLSRSAAWLWYSKIEHKEQIVIGYGACCIPGKCMFYLSLVGTKAQTKTPQLRVRGHLVIFIFSIFFLQFGMH